jgi:hypothetical protein
MNSSIQIAEAEKLAKTLVDRTSEGKLSWEPDGTLLSIVSTTDLSGATVFSTTLEGNLRATISLAKQKRAELLVFSLVEFDPQWQSSMSLIASVNAKPDKEILSVSIEKDPSFGYDTPDEMRLNGLLVDLYALARRSALKLEGSVEKALTYLDRIAG